MQFKIVDGAVLLTTSSDSGGGNGYPLGIGTRNGAEGLCEKVDQLDDTLEIPLVIIATLFMPAEIALRVDQCS